jgi:adenylosuccinate synthase
MIDFVVGGQSGDEAKGKTVGYLAANGDYTFCVKGGGGPQAGHTVTPDIKLCQVPSGLVNPDIQLCIGRGTVIYPPKVLEEVEKYGVADRLMIDPNCCIIKEEHIKKECEDLKGRIGSVGSGTGYARVDHILRKEGMKARDVPELKPFLGDVSAYVNDAIRRGEKGLGEGVQGRNISLYNPGYPFCTSQDTTVSQFASDVGIGPKNIRDIYVVFKCYETRVGPGRELLNEWSEEKMREEGILEYGTVSGRLRRIGDFDHKEALAALIENTGTYFVMSCLDRLFPGCEYAQQVGDLTSEATEFIAGVDDCFASADLPYYKGLALISVGPRLEDTLDVRNILDNNLLSGLNF